MIFDLILFHNSNKTVDNNYNFQSTLKRLSIYEKVKANSFEYTGDNWKVYGLGREGYQKQIQKNEKSKIFIVGECFSRLDSSFFKGESKKLDASEINSLYQQKATRFVEDIKGNFQIIIIDENSIKLFNSHFGVSPFYYYVNNETFICSTAIYLFPELVKLNLKFSTSKILEYALFNYPLGENTLFENVYNLLPGEIITYIDGKIFKEKYFDVSDWITEDRISKQDAIVNGIELFNKIVNTYSKDKDKITVSLTGGFDGRAILSALDFPKEKMLLYSFGIKGSQNINIPSKIAKELGYNFKPFYLEDDYESAYPEYAKLTCLLTDCLATTQRANYLYVFEQLSKHSDVVLTGIFGSELMRTFQNAGLMISNTAVNILKAKNSVDQLKFEIGNYKYKDFWGREIFNDNNRDAVIESFRSKYLNRKYNFLNQFVFTYFIKDALRKYFGGEVHAERLFATNRFPFLDDEFVEFILKSPFSAINNTFMSPTIKERLNSQIYYGYIIKKNKPELLKYKTDHGFAPKYLFYPFSFLFIGTQVIIQSKLRKYTKYREFKSEEWSQKLFEESSIMLNQLTFINVDLLKRKIINKEWIEMPEETKKLFSVQLYILEGIR